MEIRLDRTRRPEYVYLRIVNSLYQSRSPDLIDAQLMNSQSVVGYEGLLTFSQVDFV
jgi:hypothetical protein